jgi:hypothetical protein
MSASTRRPPLSSITTRLPVDEKAVFAGAASSKGISESALALMAIRAVIGPVAVKSARVPAVTAADPATDRITIRLRPGDRSALRWRAAQRGIKVSTYLASLARAHLSAHPPLTANELAAFKQSVAVLARLGTVFVEASRRPGGSEDVRRHLHQISAAVTALEHRTHALARVSLVSWETRSE